MGLEIPEETNLRICDCSAEIRYMVLPQRPDGTDQLSEQQLAALVTPDFS